VLDFVKSLIISSTQTAANDNCRLQLVCNNTIGRLATRTITGGNESFGYDAISRLTTHGTPLGSFTFGYLGQTEQTTTRSVTNGAITVSTNWGYDTNVNDRRLISITNSGQSRSFGLGYGSAPVNPYDIMSITDTAATGHPYATQSHAYTYDKIDRLLTGTDAANGNNTFVYDKADNATTFTIGATAKNPTYNAFNQVNKWDSTHTYAHDNNGNLLSGDGAKTYKYDAENRLVEVDYVGGSNKSVFSYDGLNRRTVVAETVSGVTTTKRYLWCGDRVCQVRDAADTVLKRNLPEGEFTVTGATKLICMPDQLGSVRDVIDATTGTRVKSYDYTAYGKTARNNGTGDTDYRYAGLWYHPQSTLNLAKFRAQDPATGRWINRDPIREKGGLNLYGYVKQNPIVGIDIYGLWPAPPPSVPGGPWTPAGPGQPDGSWYGPPQPNGPKPFCQYVPPETQGGPPGSKGYWKTYDGKGGTQRYDENGPQDVNESHYQDDKPKVPSIPNNPMSGPLIPPLLYIPNALPMPGEPTGPS
jgi:RHS repeat-associated protein